MMGVFGSFPGNSTFRFLSLNGIFCWLLTRVTVTFSCVIAFYHSVIYWCSFHCDRHPGGIIG